MADPLSTATRAAKRNLLVVSVLAISASAFNVKIDKIPVAGLSITFDDHLFAFLLFVTLAYFFCTFVIYYAIDISNLEQTEHQKLSEQHFAVSGGVFTEEFDKEANRRLNKAAGPEHRVMFPSALPDRWGNPEAPGATKFVFRRRGTTDAAANILPDSLPELAKEVEAEIGKLQKEYKRRLSRNRRKARGLIELIRGMYSTRVYFLDGALPILLGVVAILATFNVVPLSWLQSWFPIVGSGA